VIFCLICCTGAVSTCHRYSNYISISVKYRTAAIAGDYRSVYQDAPYSRFHAKAGNCSGHNGACVSQAIVGEPAIAMGSKISISSDFAADK
jgi:hypothetical protein